MKGQLIHVPIAKIQEPISGDCLACRYWSAHPEKGVAFWVSTSNPRKLDFHEHIHPQCNAQEFVSERLTKKLWPDHETVYVPAAFVSHAIRAAKHVLTEAKAG